MCVRLRSDERHEPSWSGLWAVVGVSQLRVDVDVCTTAFG